MVEKLKKEVKMMKVLSKKEGTKGPEKASTFQKLYCKLWPADTSKCGS